jgi:UDP-glucose 4-epimerase
MRPINPYGHTKAAVEQLLEDVHASGLQVDAPWRIAPSDGTGERDFIHVMDRAEGHLAALRHLQEQQAALLTLNLGSGTGHTVQQVVKAYEQACGQALPTQVVARRPGDAARSVADPHQAQQLLGWCCRRDLNAMCEDSWRWQQRNPSETRSAAGDH